MTRKELALRLLLGTAAGAVGIGALVPEAAQAACYRCTRIEPKRCKDIEGQRILGKKNCEDSGQTTIGCKLTGTACGSVAC